MMAQLPEKAGIVLASKIFAVSNLVAIVILIPLLGVFGAMVATGTARIFKAVLIWQVVRDIGRFKGTGIFFASQIALWLACFQIIRLVTQNMADLAALGTAFVLTGLFSILAVRLAHFSGRESDLIRKVSGVRASRILEATDVIRA